MKKFLITNIEKTHRNSKVFISKMNLLGTKLTQILESKSAPIEIREIIFLIQPSYRKSKERKDLLKVWKMENYHK
jgi:hypothetical protein